MTDTPTQTREDILKAALDGREQEIMHYQINIDNYSIALQEIGKLSPSEQLELKDFSEQLRSLLASEILEQKKAKIMLSVLKAQVG
jgi:L-rhamnose mutarotase